MERGDGASLRWRGQESEERADCGMVNRGGKIEESTAGRKEALRNTCQ
jgi:hypothetical protein